MFGHIGQSFMLKYIFNPYLGNLHKVVQFKGARQANVKDSLSAAVTDKNNQSVVYKIRSLEPGTL
jgi:hypothetical protein